MNICALILVVLCAGSWWAEIGECESNPGYLMSNCPKSCNVCRAVNGFSRDIKCVRDPSERPIVESPGGLNAMFQSIVDNPDFVKRYSIEVLSSSPWVLQFDNFAERSDWDELDRHLQGQFVGSTVVGKTLDDGTIERQTLNTRTSSNAWCNVDPCLRSTAHRKLQLRLAELLGPRVGIEHMESLQVCCSKLYNHKYPDLSVGYAHGLTSATPLSADKGDNR